MKSMASDGSQTCSSTRRGLPTAALLFGRLSFSRNARRKPWNSARPRKKQLRRECIRDVFAAFVLEQSRWINVAEGSRREKKKAIFSFPMPHAVNKMHRAALKHTPFPKHRVRISAESSPTFKLFIKSPSRRPPAPL